MQKRIKCIRAPTQTSRTSLSPRQKHCERFAVLPFGHFPCTYNTFKKHPHCPVPCSPFLLFIFWTVNNVARACLVIGASGSWSAQYRRLMADRRGMWLNTFAGTLEPERVLAGFKKKTKIDSFISLYSRSAMKLSPWSVIAFEKRSLKFEKSII